MKGFTSYGSSCRDLDESFTHNDTHFSSRSPDTSYDRGTFRLLADWGRSKEDIGKPVDVAFGSGTPRACKALFLLKFEKSKPGMVTVRAVRA